MEEIPGIYQHLVDHSPVGTWVLEPDGTTVWFTPVLCEMLGRTPEQLDGMAAQVVFDAQGQADFEAFLTRMRADAGREPEVECLLHRPDGSARWVMIGASTLHSEDRTLFVLQVVDHEGRKSLIEDLTEAQRLGKLGSWNYELSTGQATWSQEMFHLMGRDPNLGPMSLAEFREALVAEDRSLLRTDAMRGRFTEELRFQRPDRSLRWLRVEGRTILQAPGGEPARLVASVQDITEQKQLELTLREAGRVGAFVRGLATAANESPTVASTLDLVQERMSAVDPSMRLITFRPVTSIGGSLTLVPGYPGRDTSRLTKEQLTPTPREVEIARAAYLSRHVQFDDVSSPGLVLVASNLMDDVEVVAIVVLTATRGINREGWREVAEASAAQVQQVLVRERTNEALAEARDAALEATRQKSAFLATMSHEIRTPLNGVIGLNDLLLRSDLDSGQQRLAHGVKAAGHSLLTVINDILDFSKIEAGKLALESVDFELREVLDLALSLLGQRAAEKGIELAVEVLPDVPAFIRGDPTRLSQVVTNLVSNAVKFTDRGEVIVRCSVQAADGPSDQRVAHTDVDLRFEVRDTGIGIAPANLQGLFAAFTQAESSTTRNFGGTGLGLAISRQLVAALRGQIGVESEPGMGSTFWFTGRFGPGDAALVSRTAAAATRHLLEGRRMLVVDDSASSRRILAAMLAQWQVRVESAGGADEAVERIRRASARGEAFEVVLLDLDMPGRNGLELAGLITSTTAEPWPTMLLLSPAEGVGDQQLLDAGVARNLTKPVAHSALFDGLVEALVEVHGLQAVALAAVPSESALKLGQRILVVEDNQINQMVAQGVLEALGYESDVAADGEEAVRMAVAADYDAIVMDIQMPNMDGYTATRLIREAEGDGTGVPIIAMTAGTVEGEGQRCLDGGMDAYLTKPLQPDLLERALRQHILDHERDRLDFPADPAGVEDPVLDTSRLETLRQMGADALPLVDRIIVSFLAGAPDSLAAVRGAIDAGDPSELARVAHKLRGSAANLGATQVSGICQELEQRGRDKSTWDTRELLASLGEALDDTMVLLRDQLLPVAR